MMQLLIREQVYAKENYVVYLAIPSLKKLSPAIIYAKAGFDAWQRLIIMQIMSLLALTYLYIYTSFGISSMFRDLWHYWVIENKKRICRWVNFCCSSI